MSILNIANDFSEFTGLRHCDVSDNSGEQFYHEVLNKAFHDQFQKKEKLIVVLDDVDGFASSFLDESFGNLVYDFHESNVRPLLEIVSEEEPHWIKVIMDGTLKEWEKRRVQKKSAKVTAMHSPWYRLTSQGTIESKVWINPEIE